MMRMELMIWMFKGWWEWNWWYECLKDDENETDDMNETGPSTQKFIADKFREGNYVQCTTMYIDSL